MKGLPLKLLNRLGLLGPAYQTWEHIQSLGFNRIHATDGLPLPPRLLRVQVTGSPDPSWFLQSGQLAARTIHAALERAGTSLDQMGSILDFGCGCGRVLRHWQGLPTHIIGTDIHPEAIAWGKKNLPFAEWRVNELAPPLAIKDAHFDLIYAFSVLTHLPLDLQLSWLQEFYRILAPNGYLILSVHGAHALEQPTPEEKQKFQRGECVTRWHSVAGKNLCNSYHPPAFIQGPLSQHFQLREHLPEGALGNPPQDLIVLRKA